MNQLNERVGDQQGSVLLISLMLLIVVTLLTFAASDLVMVQGKMTANSRDDLLAFEVAESAAKEAEQKLLDYDFTIDGGVLGHYDGECDEDDPGCYIVSLGDLYDAATWEKSTQAVKTISCGNGDPACQLAGRYIIIRMGTVDTTLSRTETVQSFSNQYQDQGEGAIGDVFKYKVIAKGTGINPDNQRVIVTYFAAAE